MAASWVEGVAFSGYVAVMVCRRVQVLEPRRLTSGGHGISVVVDGDCDCADDSCVVVDCGAVDVAVVVVVVAGVWRLVMDAQAAKELHDRHLFGERL